LTTKRVPKAARRPHRIIRTRGQRIAWRNTSRIPDAELVAAIKYVAQHVNLDGVVIHAKRHGYNRRTLGRAYGYLPRVTNLDGLRRVQWRYLVVITDHYSPGSDKPVPMDEAILDTLAHEAKHVEQFRERLPRSEVRACHFAGVVSSEWAAAS
jgi:hypothetical protein